MQSSPFSPPFPPFISCCGVICCLVFIPLVSIKWKSGVEDCKSLHVGPVLIPYLRTPPAKATIWAWGMADQEEEGKETFEPFALGPLTRIYFLFLGFVFSAGGTCSAPAPPGLVENSFLQNLTVRFKEVVWSWEEGSSVIALCPACSVFLSTWKYELCKQFIFHIPPVAKPAKADKGGCLDLSPPQLLESSHCCLYPPSPCFSPNTLTHTHHCPDLKEKYVFFPKYFILTMCYSLGPPPTGPSSM